EGGGVVDEVRRGEDGRLAPPPGEQAAEAGPCQAAGWGYLIPPGVFPGPRRPIPPSVGPDRGPLAGATARVLPGSGHRRSRGACRLLAPALHGAEGPPVHPARAADLRPLVLRARVP